MFSVLFLFGSRVHCSLIVEMLLALPMAVPRGIEPRIFGVKGRRVNQFHYGTIFGGQGGCRAHYPEGTDLQSAAFADSLPAHIYLGAKLWNRTKLKQRMRLSKIPTSRLHGLSERIRTSSFKLPKLAVYH